MSSDTPNDEDEVPQAILRVEVGPRDGRQRLVVVLRGDEEIHRDQFNTDTSQQRRRWLREVARQLRVEPGTLGHLDRELRDRADEADTETNDSSDESGRGPSHAVQLVQLTADMEFFHDAEGLTYASFTHEGHRETWPLKSKGFDTHLSYKMYQQEQTAPSSQAKDNALNILEGKAIFEGDEVEVHLRYAEHNGDIYVDLANAAWQAVRITPQGWEVVNDPPVRFRRTGGMLALPTPEQGGSLEDLNDFLNVTPVQRPLLTAWLVNAVKPRGPYPVMVLVGEQGTGKSTLSRVLRGLLDPNKSPLRAEPKNIEDLQVAAQNGWVLAFDNLSRISPDLSDALCRLSTGGGFSTRRHYTNDEEVIFNAQRPIIVNSIADIARRSDLLDRALLLTLERIPDFQRQTEEAYWAAFEYVRPRLLGALYTLVSTALRTLPSIHLNRKPRMADFACWAVAAEPGMNIPLGTFMSRYVENQQSAHDLALESAPITEPLISFIRSLPGQTWTGTATQLLRLLNQDTSDRSQRLPNWPKDATRLSSMLREITPNLRDRNVVVEHNRTARDRLIRINVENTNNTDGTPAQPDRVTPPSPGRPDADVNPSRCGSDDAGDANDGRIAGQRTQTVEQREPQAPADGEWVDTI